METQQAHRSHLILPMPGRGYSGWITNDVEEPSTISPPDSVSVERPTATEGCYRFVSLGAAVAVIAWAATSLGFSLYLANFADYSATYGSLGGAIGLLLYLYLSACVVLFGAEVNAAIHHHSLQTHGERKGSR